MRLASGRPVSVLAVAIMLASAGCALQHHANDASRGDVTPVDAPIDGFIVDGQDVPPIDTPIAEGGDAPDVPDVQPDVPDTGPCTGSLVLCGSNCVDLQVDPTHCGACGTACSPGDHAQATCAAGTCGILCEAGYDDCDHNAANGCETWLGSGSNCGACGVTCSGGTPTCSAGTGSTYACSSGCSGTEMLCGASCVDTQTSPANCGMCGTACNVTNGVAGCATGRCNVAGCNPGYGNCDGTYPNGCEVNTNTSLMNCGMCGRACATGANASATCSGGTCGLACNTGYRNCDGANANGCEIHITNDAANCGACGNVCSFAHAPATCNTGACVMGTCSAGYGDCNRSSVDGCESTFATDPDHCGNCMTSCPSNVCTAGTCRVPVSCNEIHTARPSLPSGSYQIDPDGAGGSAAFMVNCDMSTAGGGWTIIFDAGTMTNYNVSSLDYTVTDTTLRNTATDALIAFRNSDTARTVVGNWARFPMPSEWIAMSPFQYGNTDVTTNAIINGTGMSGLNLRFGWHGFGTDCASGWNSGAGNAFGRVCIDGTTAPFFAGFDDSTADSCQDSSQTVGTTACASTRRFTIAVR